jgi:hypothetical protein
MSIDIGQVAYEGYLASTGAKVDEDGWPGWDHLPPEAREHWRASADAVTMFLDLTASRPEITCPDHRPVHDSAVGWYCAACGSDTPPG